MPKSVAHQFSNHLSCQTLSGLTLEHLPRDGSLGRTKRYDKNANIWLPEDRADRIYFLKRGQAAVLTGDTAGHEVILRVIEEGEPFGELCFCSQEKGFRHTFGRAVINCEALEIRHEDFVGYLRSSEETMTAFLFTFCEQLGEMERRVEILAHRGAEERLGNLLLLLAAAPGDKESEVVLYVSHGELAQMAAMSRTHVTITMGKFRRRGFVHYERNRPLTINVPALKSHLDKV